MHPVSTGASLKPSEHRRTMLLLYLRKVPLAALQRMAYRGGNCVGSPMGREGNNPESDLSQGAQRLGETSWRCLEAVGEGEEVAVFAHVHHHVCHDNGHSTSASYLHPGTRQS